MATNTTSAQDQILREAENTDHIANLVGIIDDLDAQITAANNDLKTKDDLITELEDEIYRLKETVEKLEAGNQE